MPELSKKILLVEDDPDLLNLVNQKFLSEGFLTIPVDSGQKALDYLKTDQPDLVLLDILLPDIDGLTVLNEITQNQKTRNIPVIVLSNLDEPGSFEQVSALGDYEYLVKAKTELNELVKRVKVKLKIGPGSS